MARARSASSQFKATSTARPHRPDRQSEL